MISGQPCVRMGFLEVSGCSATLALGRIGKRRIKTGTSDGCEDEIECS